MDTSPDKSSICSIEKIKVKDQMEDLSILHPKQPSISITTIPKLSLGVIIVT